MLQTVYNEFDKNRNHTLTILSIMLAFSTGFPGLKPAFVWKNIPLKKKKAVNSQDCWTLLKNRLFF